jgi:AraC-like DNA-binding protein
LVQRFSVNGVDRPGRVDILDTAARNSSVPFRAAAADPAQPIRFKHLDRYFGGVNLTWTRLSNFEGHRPGRLSRQQTEPRLVMTVTTGRYAVEQHTQFQGAPTGSMVSWWSIAPCRFTVREPIVVRTATVSMSALGLPHLFLRDMIVRDLGPTPLGPLVARHLSDLAALPELSGEQAAALELPTVDLIRALLTTAGSDESLSRQPLARTLGVRIMLYLRAHFSDPDLNADSLAARFGISRRYLYTVLAQMDVTLRDWVLAQRLDRAARQLRNPANAMASVAAIAHQSGFVDHSSFSRAFRKRFGCTPTEWRRSAPS